MNCCLQRITTEYSEVEDRLRLAGEHEQAGARVQVLVWLSQRLLRRLLPAMLAWLEAQRGASQSPALILGFAQQAARATLQPQAPVQVGVEAAAWLAQAVDITRYERALGLTFRSGTGAEVTLLLEVQALRQWVNMLYDQTNKAQWALEIWPDWMRESVVAAAGAGLVLH